MEPIKVYLAGPINGCTDVECKDWRESVKSVLGEASTLDPMRRDYRGREEECVNEIVELDKKDIDEATHLLVNYPHPSTGTDMEIYYAWERKNQLWLWFQKESVVVHGSFITALKSLNHLMKR